MNELTFVYDIEEEKLYEASMSEKIAFKIATEIENSSGKYVYSLSPGGEIIFSTKVSNKKIYNWFRRIGFSILNKFLTLNKTQKLIEEKFKQNGLLQFGWTIETGLKGHYQDIETGEETNEPSIKITLNNTPMNVIEEIATELCKFFKQESVLIHDLEKNTYKYWSAN